MDSAPVFVACIQCRLVCRYESRQLFSELETMGVAPYDPDAPMRVFPVRLGCGVLNCETPREVLAVRSSDTSGEALKKEKSSPDVDAGEAKVHS